MKWNPQAIVQGLENGKIQFGCGEDCICRQMWVFSCGLSMPCVSLSL